MSTMTFKKKRKDLIIEGLQRLLEDIDLELSRIDSRLLNMCIKLGVNSIEELDKIFKSRDMDYPELDLLWVEYRYLIEKRQKKLIQKGWRF